MSKTAKEVLPYMNLYGRDLFTDPLVEVMTTEQVGAHCLLIMRSWFETPGGSVPDDDRTLARWVHAESVEGWQAFKGGVLAAWHLKDGRWFQKRVVKEFREACTKQRKAKAAAVARWEKQNANGHAYAMRSHSGSNAIRTDQNRSDQIRTDSPPKPPKGGQRGSRQRRAEIDTAAVGTEAVARYERVKGKQHATANGQ